MLVRKEGKGRHPTISNSICIVAELLYNTTVEPPLSGHTLLNGHMSKSQKYLVYIIKDKTSIERSPLLSGRGHLRVVPSSVF